MEDQDIAVRAAPSNVEAVVVLLREAEQRLASGPALAPSRGFRSDSRRELS